MARLKSQHKTATSHYRQFLHGLSDVDQDIKWRVGRLHHRRVHDDGEHQGKQPVGCRDVSRIDRSKVCAVE